MLVGGWSTEPTFASDLCFQCFPVATPSASRCKAHHVGAYTNTIMTVPVRMMMVLWFEIKPSIAKNEAPWCYNWMDGMGHMVLLNIWRTLSFILITRPFHHLANRMVHQH